MTATWALNAVGVYLTSVGALLIFLYVLKSHRFADAWLLPEGKPAYAKHNRRLIAGTGFLAAWLVLQCLSIILS